VKLNSITPNNLIDTLSSTQKKVARFINMNESEADLTTVRLGQDIATNWIPKVPFVRSLADFADMSVLEFSENALVYFGPRLLGENLFRKVYSKHLDAVLQKKIATPAVDLLASKDKDTKILMPIKAAIAVACLAIPLAEYSLNYVKNLFTLKVFKQADFNNIANLNKNKIEDPEHQKKVKESAKKHIKLAGLLTAGCFALSALLATKGKNSKFLSSLSEAVLAPGNKLFKNDAKKAVKFNKYFSIDFANKNGRLVMSNGQLTSCVVVGGVGYFGSAKDRGKQNFLEVLYRFPLVGFYVITGSTLFEKGFKKMLQNKESYKNIIGKDLAVPKLHELPQLAQKIAAKNKTSVEAEYKKLFKQKSMIVLAPFLFSVGVMGFFVAGVSRYFTQYRYNRDAKRHGGKEA